MAINFPNSPSVDDTHVVGDTTYTWDGTSWVSAVAGGGGGSLGGLSDVDLATTAPSTDDVLTYDVYFGKENPPLQKVGSNQAASQLSVNVISSTNYYWKVVVLDSKGGKTIGQVWNFNTD